MNHTTILKGIAIILVVWGHVGKVNNVEGIQFIAGAGVSLFLICSGFGLEMSYKKSGLKAFWKKKIINVIIPFYLVSIVGYCINNYSNITWAGVRRILSFESQWYINYLLICYVLFWVMTICIKNENIKLLALAIAFTIWFVIDTMFFVSEEAPFLKARQMGAFLSGIAIANSKLRSEEVISKKTFCGLNFFIGVTFMIITNTGYIKGLPVIVGNLLSLGTVVPLAYSIISISSFWKKLCNNKTIFLAGVFSYEIFLVHSYSLKLVSNEWYLILIFILLVICFSWIIHRTWDCIKKTLIK